MGDQISSVVKIVTAAVFRDQDRILLARRSPGSTLAGKWEFPGGKIEGNESPEDCLRREIHEELGVLIRVEKMVCSSEYVYDHGSFRIIAFWVRVVSGNLEPKVHDLLEWAPVTELCAFDLLPADIPIAKAVAAQIAAAKLSDNILSA